jgi:hypothetical protein
MRVAPDTTTESTAYSATMLGVEVLLPFFRSVCFWMQVSSHGDSVFSPGPPANCGPHYAVVVSGVFVSKH